MKKNLNRRRPKRILRLPDLDHSKTAVLNTLGSPESQRSYRFAIDDFIAWYCSDATQSRAETSLTRVYLGRNRARATRLRDGRPADDDGELAFPVHPVRAARRQHDSPVLMIATLW